MTRILVFAGSAREASFNKKLARAAADIASGAGNDVTFIDLAEFPVAVYNGDDEERDGLPANVRELKKLFSSHDAFLISTPEYNGHVPPLLVNVFDWASRSEGDEAGLAVYAGKVAGIMATSPGRLGGIRVLPRLRDKLAELGVVVASGFVTLPRAGKAFDDDGKLTDEKVSQQIDALVKRVVALTV